MQCQMVYRTTHGVLDTLHWEGFREGVDDVRYLTTLLNTLNGVIGRFPHNPLVAQTHAWLTKLDVANGDLDDIRREMARRIMALLDLGSGSSPEQLLKKIDLRQVKIVTIPEPWRFKIDPHDQGVKEKWFDPAIDDTKWVTIRTDKKAGWETQGFADQKVGHGWYRTDLPLKHLSRKFIYLALPQNLWVFGGAHERPT